MTVYLAGATSRSAGGVSIFPTEAIFALEGADLRTTRSLTPFPRRDSEHRFSVTMIVPLDAGKLGVTGAYGPAAMELGGHALPAGTALGRYLAIVGPDPTVEKLRAYPNATFTTGNGPLGLVSPVAGELVLTGSFVGSADFGSGLITSANGGKGDTWLVVSAP